MSHAYHAVGWNRQKKRYDAFLWLGVVVYLIAFLGIGFALNPLATASSLAASMIEASLLWRISSRTPARAAASAAD